VLEAVSVVELEVVWEEVLVVVLDMVLEAVSEQALVVVWVVG
jgi:hypothetical protein